MSHFTRVILTVAFSLVSCFRITAQIRLLSENIRGNNYSLSFKCQDTKHKIYYKNGKKLIEFENIAEAPEERFSMPSQDVFIAVPPNSRPQVSLNITKRYSIDAIPEDAGRYSIDDAFRVRGYLWIGDTYCMHMSLRLYDFDFQHSSTLKNEEFEVNLRFSQPLPLYKAQLYSASVGDPVVNASFGKLFNARAEYKLAKTGDWIDYGAQYLKVGTARDGIYRLYASDLSQAGLDLNHIDPSTFRLYTGGKEIPIYVSTQGASIGASDYIEFIGSRNYGGHHREVSQYGTAYNEYLDRYTDTTSYFLTWNGAKGKRAGLSDGTSGVQTGDSIKYCNEVLHYEVNNWFDYSMQSQIRRESPYWYENKTWNEGNFGVGTTNKYFVARDIYPNQNFTAYIKFQDYASNILSKAHLIALGINGQGIKDSTYVDKYEQKVIASKFSSNLLKEGGNNLNVYSLPTKASLNACIWDWHEIEYPRYIRAVSDSIIIRLNYLDSSPKLRHMSISNLSTDDFSLWKTGDGFKKYSLTRVQNAVSLTDSISGLSRFILESASKILRPRIYYLKQFVNLRASSNSADYIAITHKKFLPKASEYVAFIHNQYGINTRLIDVDDIYDEFSYGFFKPEAIRDFLQAARSLWAAPYPSSLFLIGAATYDYYGYKTKNFGAPKTYNYVPSFGSPVSDNWFVAWDSTAYVPQMNVGRLPVSELSELDSYMKKHQEYVSNPYTPWNKRIIMFSGGNGDDSTQIAQFKAVNDFVINNYVVPPPFGGNYSHFYKTINPKTNFGPFSQPAVQGAIDDGSLFIAYLGHSGTQTWDNSITDPSQLRNSYNYHPLITDFGCSTARFAEPDIKSFAELFTVSNEGQAIAYIGNSSLGFVSSAVVMPQLFYKRVIQDSVYCISKALKLAKLDLVQQYGGSGVNGLFALTNTLVGDPIVSLPIPPKPNLSITTSGIKALQSSITDNMDSVGFLIRYNNLGRVTQDTFRILVQDNFSGAVVYSREFVRAIPSWKDSVIVNIPVLKKSGEHRLSVKLDSGSRINEIYKTDNNTEYGYLVSSSSVKDELPNEVENQKDTSLIFLSPSLKTNSESIYMEFSQSPDFTVPRIMSAKMDTFFTKVSLSSLDREKRYFVRTRLNNESTFGLVKSFVPSNENAYLLCDSLSFNRGIFSNTKYTKIGVGLDTVLYKLSVTSAGLNDGNSAVIALNSQTLIPENTLIGHHVCIFDSQTYKFIGYRKFNVFGGGASEINNYIKFLDTLNARYLIAVAISDCGNFSSQELSSKLKSYGSSLVDKIGFRYSWAFIGKKGAVPGTYPEALSAPFQGPAKIGETFYQRHDQGIFLSSVAGPVAAWKDLNISSYVPSSSSMKIRPIGLRDDGRQDTLSYLSIIQGKADLSGIDPKVYPRLRIQAEFQGQKDSASPSMSRLRMDYSKLPELGLNYQTVQVNRDTVNQGDNIGLQFAVCNAGGDLKDTVTVCLGLLKPDNSQTELRKWSMPPLPSGGKARFEFNRALKYSDGYGSMAFIINVDGPGKIRELYRDNNSYNCRFFVKKDTATSINMAKLRVTFDGSEIHDGDYVSSMPIITAELVYPTWFNLRDSSAVRFALDGKIVPPSLLDTVFDSTNRRVTFRMRPKLLEGEHSLEITGKNIYGKYDNSGYTTNFLVSDRTKILFAYNYPNPFSDKTYFTFKLTKIPDELKIRLYTVAGRLIREFNLGRGQLRYDFNLVYFDGRDQDGDQIANGTYLYKILSNDGGKRSEITGKLSRVR